MFDDAEELFPSPAHSEPNLCTTVQPTDPMLGTTEAEQDTDIEHNLQHNVQWNKNVDIKHYLEHNNQVSSV